MEENKELTQEVRKLNILLSKEIKLQSFWRSILRGIANSIGWILGIAILLTISAYLVEKFSGMPIFGKILEYIRLAAGRGR